MSTSKHPSPSAQPVKGEDDLVKNPGIGQSPGLQDGDDFDLIEGDNTAEGDTGNDTKPDGSLDPDQDGQTSKQPR
jgi:hypothetical protein